MKTNLSRHSAALDRFDWDNQMAIRNEANGKPIGRHTNAVFRSGSQCSQLNPPPHPPCIPLSITLFWMRTKKRCGAGWRGEATKIIAKVNFVNCCVAKTRRGKGGRKRERGGDRNLCGFSVNLMRLSLKPETSRSSNWWRFAYDCDSFILLPVSPHPFRPDSIHLRDFRN